MKICKICLITKQLEEFPRAGTYNGEPSYRGECKTCNQEKQRTNPANKAAQKKYKTSEKGQTTRKKLRSNPEVRERENQQERERYHDSPEYRQRRIDKSVRIIYHKLANDPVFRGMWYIKNALRQWVKINGERKDSKIGNYIGCTKDEFKSHIEKRFKSGMTWDNHGEWEFDHIIPISSAKTMEEAYKLTHHTNFQPLWKLDNRTKSDKMPGEE
jgi:hypothetical protein